VLGPYDNTNRYWCIIEWIKQGQSMPQEINDRDQQCKLSFVYSVDVAKTIVYLIRNREAVEKGKSYNLGFRDMPTYKELIEQIVRITLSRQNQSMKQSHQISQI
jgi:nucleoside-diphosphate-sugar epimerase